MSKKSSNLGSSYNTIEEYVIKILDDINFHPQIIMKPGFTGKIRNRSSIAKSIKTIPTNQTFLKSLEFAVKQDWLIHIKTKKDFNNIFTPNSRYRSDYTAPSFVLTEKGISFAKSVTFTKFTSLSDMLKTIISDEANDEKIKQIDDLFKDYDNPFSEFKKLKIFDID
jgi:hypothetical protein